MNIYNPIFTRKLIFSTKDKEKEMEFRVKGNNTVTLSKFHRNSIGFIYRRRSFCKKLIEFRSRGPIRGLINTEERKESG